MGSTSEWAAAQFYQRTDLGRIDQATTAPSPVRIPVTDATVVTATISKQSNNYVISSNSNNSHHGAEGRVGKAQRKRTRVSKRAPTTFLNTDKHNFRAMVQQFTGGPSAQFFTGLHGGSNLYFGHHHQIGSRAFASTAMQTTSQHPEELVLLAAGDGRGKAVDDYDGQLFLQGFTNPRPNLDAFLFDGAPSNLQPQDPSFRRW